MVQARLGYTYGFVKYLKVCQTFSDTSYSRVWMINIWRGGGDWGELSSAGALWTPHQDNWDTFYSNLEITV